MTIFPVRFDPRSKLCAIFCASLALLFPLPFSLESALIGLFAGGFFVSGYWKKALLFLLFFVGLLGVNQWMSLSQTPVFLTIVDFLMVGNRRLLPTIMAASFAVSGTTTSEWLAALQKLRVPMQLLVPLTVLVRFFPMTVQEMIHIRQAMKFRGIATNPWQLISHPLQSMEYLIVPLLLSAEETSMNLSATALVRGLANPIKHTSVHALHLKIPDYVFMGSLISCFVVRMWQK